ncbi:MAG: thioredoxin domain-containing protein [Myxococcales bacterium]|nr:thioredoxin domain-containing protein [Myxococcales bacterium]
MQTPRKCNENRSLFGRVIGSIAAVMTVGFLAGASCKKDTGTPRTDPKDVVNAADHAQGSGTTGASAPLDRTPIPGFDVSTLDSAKADLFFKMVGTLSSPCGKAHSLRTSFAQDGSCKRAPFAVKLVHDLIVDEQSEDTVRAIFEERYVKNNKVWTINVVGAPTVGSADAPVTLVEFFDYGCPACVALKPVLDRVIAENKGKLKVYYKMYPLVSKHPDSFGCAQAAFAASVQGKFHEMHDLVFEKFGNQKKDDLRRYAGDLGLDLGRFDADYAAAEPRVKADMKDGTDVGVDGTPTLFLNGRLYGGPADPKYMAAAIDEEIAVRAAAAEPAPAAPAPAPAPAAAPK